MIRQLLDDGSPQDERLAEMLDRFALEATFLDVKPWSECR